MKKFCFILALCVLCGCEVIDPEENEIEESEIEEPEENVLNLNDFGNPNSKTELWVGTEDPLLLKTVTQDNESIELYGLRDFEGVPSTITHMVVKNAIDQTTIFELNSGKITKITGYDGTVFNLNWIGSDEFGLSVITPNKEVIIEPDEIISLSRDNANSSNNRLPAYQHLNSGITTTALSSFVLDSAGKEAVNSDSKSSNSLQAKLKLYRCDKLTNYIGMAKIETYIGDILVRNTYLSQSSRGVYIGKIGYSLFPPVHPQKMCDAMMGLINPVCDAYNVDSGGAIVLGNLICAQIAIYGSATVVGAPIATALGGVCVALNTSLALSCMVLPELTSRLCSNSAFKKFSLTGQQLKIKPVLTGPDGDFEGQTMQIDVRNPIPEISLDLGDEYEHFVKISIDYSTCPYSDAREIYIDNILVGYLYANKASFVTKIKNGDHLIYLGVNGENTTINGGSAINLPCYGVIEEPLEMDFFCVY